MPDCLIPCVRQLEVQSPFFVDCWLLCSIHSFPNAMERVEQTTSLKPPFFFIYDLVRIEEVFSVLVAAAVVPAVLSFVGGLSEGSDSPFWKEWSSPEEQPAMNQKGGCASSYRTSRTRRGRYRIVAAIRYLPRR